MNAHLGNAPAKPSNPCFSQCQFIPTTTYQVSAITAQHPHSSRYRTCSSASTNGFPDAPSSSWQQPYHQGSDTARMLGTNNYCLAAALSASMSSFRYLRMTQTSRMNWLPDYLASAACKRTKCNLDALCRRLHPPA